MADEGTFETRSIVHLLAQILEELQELRREIRDLPREIATEVSARL